MKKEKNLSKLLPSVKTNIPLKNYTTFRIGGPAKYFYTAKNKQSLIKAVKTAKELKIPFFILGRGSNLLVADEGYDGLVIKIKSPNYSKLFQIKSKVQNPKINIGAGTSLNKLVNEAAERGLSGMEWAVGIPGATVGGAIRGNAGAFGQSMSDITKIVTVLEITNSPEKKSKISNEASKLQTKVFKNKDCKFGYRDSIFKHNKNLIILSVEIELKKGDKEEIKKRMVENLKWRKENQPLNFPSAGSIFQNVKLKMKNEKLQSKIKKDKNLKSIIRNNIIPVGWLIEKCGLKGKIIGKAQISEKHANFIVNLRGAKSKDVLGLINLAKRKVKEKFGIDLKEEIVILSVSEK